GVAADEAGNAGGEVGRVGVAVLPAGVVGRHRQRRLGDIRGGRRGRAGQDVLAGGRAGQPEAGGGDGLPRAGVLVGERRRAAGEADAADVLGQHAGERVAGDDRGGGAVVDLVGGG